MKSGCRLEMALPVVEISERIWDLLRHMHRGAVKLISGDINFDEPGGIAVPRIGNDCRGLL